MHTVKVVNCACEGRNAEGEWRSKAGMRRRRRLLHIGRLGTAHDFNVVKVVRSISLIVDCKLRGLAHDIGRLNDFLPSALRTTPPEIWPLPSSLPHRR